jgi:hypothetical protein
LDIPECRSIGVVDCLGQIVPGVPPLVNGDRVWKKEIPFFLNDDVERDVTIVEEVGMEKCSPMKRVTRDSMTWR